MKYVDIDVMQLLRPDLKTKRLIMVGLVPWQGSRIRQWVQPLRAERWQGRSRCVKQGSLCCGAAARSMCCSAPLLQHSTRTFLDFFCCQLKEFCKGFAKQQARGAGGKSRRSASLPLPLPAGLRQG